MLKRRRRNVGRRAGPDTVGLRGPRLRSTPHCVDGAGRGSSQTARRGRLFSDYEGMEMEEAW
jgi:hypothetical protein